MLLFFIHLRPWCILLGNIDHDSNGNPQQCYDKQVLGISLVSWRRLTKSSWYFGLKTDGLPTASCDLIGTPLGVSREKLLLSNSILQQYTTCLQTPLAADSASLAPLSARCMKTAFPTRLLWGSDKGGVIQSLFCERSQDDESWKLCCTLQLFLAKWNVVVLLKVDYKNLLQDICSKNFR